MISLIICSRSTTLSPTLSANIADTVGCDYEIVFVDNSKNEFNMFSAYNEGVRLAKGEILCFMHEDIIYHSTQWGKLLEEHFNKHDIGALGVAGGHYVAKELDWRFYGFSVMSLIQGVSTIGRNSKYAQIKYPDPCDDISKLTQVATLDGVWICIRKELFERISWDEDNFHDFHLYDSDICMQINQLGLNVYVCHDIILEHLSAGTYTESYNDNLNVFFKKWNDILPLSRGMSVTEEMVKRNLEIGRTIFYKRLSDDKIKTSIIKKIDAGEEEKITSQEQKYLFHSDFILCKDYLKSKHLSDDDAYALLKEYLSSDSPLIFKCKFFYKYMWYRVFYRNKLR